MKSLFTSFIVFLFVLSSQTSLAGKPKDYNFSDKNEKHELYRFFDLYGGLWHTWGEGSWELSFGYGGKSKLEFKDIDSNMFLVGARIRPYLNFITIDFRYGFGSISSGKGIDSDWIDDELFSKSSSEIDGDTKYWSLDLNVLILPYRRKTGKPLHLVTLEAFSGWFHYEDNLEITNGVQLTPPTGSFSGLKSSYDFKWEGLRVGLKYEWDFIKKPSLLLYGMGIKIIPAILLLVKYEGEGTWNLRDDFAQNPSFEQEADGYGFEGQIGLFYSPFKHFKIVLAYSVIQLEAKNGKDVTFFSDGTTGDSYLNTVKSDRHGILFLISYYF
jgi:hypothetical protein